MRSAGGLLFFWFLVLERWVNNANSKDSGGSCYGNLVLSVSSQIVVFWFLVVWVECLVAGLVHECPPPSNGVPSAFIGCALSRYLHFML
jgi:hypothetical protein